MNIGSLEGTTFSKTRIYQWHIDLNGVNTSLQPNIWVYIDLVSRHSCVCSTPDSMINTQMCLYLFYKEKCVMTLISMTHDQSLSPYPCIYDAYIVIRRIQNYRDSTLSKNHPIILLTHPSHSSSHSHLHLSHLSPTLMVIRPSPITGLHLS